MRWFNKILAWLYPQFFSEYQIYCPICTGCGEDGCCRALICEQHIVRRHKKYFDFDKPDGEEEYTVEEVSTIVYRGHGFWVDDESVGWGRRGFVELGADGGNRRYLFNARFNAARP